MNDDESVETLFAATQVYIPALFFVTDASTKLLLLDTMEPLFVHVTLGSGQPETVHCTVTFCVSLTVFAPMLTTDFTGAVKN